MFPPLCFFMRIHYLCLFLNLAGYSFLYVYQVFHNFPSSKKNSSSIRYTVVFLYSLLNEYTSQYRESIFYILNIILWKINFFFPPPPRFSFPFWSHSISTFSRSVLSHFPVLFSVFIPNFSVCFFQEKTLFIFRSNVFLCPVRKSTFAICTFNTNFVFSLYYFYPNPPVS